MNVKVFTIKFNTLTESFDDTEVRAFLADKEVLSLHDHAFTKQGTPYLLIVAVYHGMTHHPENSAPINGKNHANIPDESWRKILTQADYPLYDTLREWRAQKGKEGGMPHYIVCTNKQLAEIAHQRPTSLNALSKIEGLGQNRLKKYGQELLAILHPSTSGTMIPEGASENETFVPDQDTPF